MNQVAVPLEPGVWRTSSFSVSGECVAWMLDPPVVRVRNSNDIAAGEVQFTYGEWEAFLRGVASGEANLPE